MLRISKNFTWNNGAWQEQSVKARIYDGLNVVQERDGQGDLVALYVRGVDMGGGIGGLLARVFDVGTSFMHYDGHGNVVQLTEASGVVSGKYTYDAFGRMLSVTGGAAGLNPYRFSTKEHVGGLVYYGYRFYSPSLGKWINRDPIVEQGGVNLQLFLNNSPVNYIDHYGHIPAWAIITIACFIGGILVVGSIYFGNFLNCRLFGIGCGKKPAVGTVLYGALIGCVVGGGITGIGLGPPPPPTPPPGGFPPVAKPF